METFNNAEIITKVSLDEFSRNMSKVYSENKDVLAVALDSVRTKYAQDFGGDTLDGLFSSHKFAQFYDQTTTDPVMQEWADRQVRELTRLGNELTISAEGQDKADKAEELIDYLVNV